MQRDAPWSLKGKVALILRSSSGAGLRLARDLHRRGANVVLTGHTRQEVEAAAALVRRDSKPGMRVEAMVVDLASLRSVRSFADHFKRTHPKLHIFVPCADDRPAEGHEFRAMVEGRSNRVLGVDPVLVANHLAPFLLVQLFTPILAACAPARIVLVCGRAHWHGSAEELQELKKPPGAADRLDLVPAPLNAVAIGSTIGAGLLGLNSLVNLSARAALQSLANAQLACMLYAYELQRRLAKGSQAQQQMRVFAAVDGNAALAALLVRAPGRQVFVDRPPPICGVAEDLPVVASSPESLNVRLAREVFSSTQLLCAPKPKVKKAQVEDEPLPPLLKAPSRPYAQPRSRPRVKEGPAKPPRLQSTPQGERPMDSNAPATPARSVAGSEAPTPPRSVAGSDSRSESPEAEPTGSSVSAAIELASRSQGLAPALSSLAELKEDQAEAAPPTPASSAQDGKTAEHGQEPHAASAAAAAAPSEALPTAGVVAPLAGLASGAPSTANVGGLRLPSGRPLGRPSARPSTRPSPRPPAFLSAKPSARTAERERVETASREQAEAADRERVEAAERERAEASARERTEAADHARRAEEVRKAREKAAAEAEEKRRLAEERRAHTRQVEGALRAAAWPGLFSSIDVPALEAALEPAREAEADGKLVRECEERLRIARNREASKRSQQEAEEHARLEAQKEAEREERLAEAAILGEEQRRRQEEEERKRQEAEEAATAAAEAQRMAEEQARREAEWAAWQEAEARREEEERLEEERRLAEEARREAEERARRAEEERLKVEEARLKKEAEERRKREAHQKIERARLEASARLAKKLEEDRARKREQEETRRRQAEERLRRDEEQVLLARRRAEERAKVELERARAKREEERAREEHFRMLSMQERKQEQEARERAEEAKVLAALERKAARLKVIQEREAKRREEEARLLAEAAERDRQLAEEEARREAEERAWQEEMARREAEAAALATAELKRAQERAAQLLQARARGMAKEVAEAEAREKREAEKAIAKMIEFRKAMRKAHQEREEAREKLEAQRAERVAREEAQRAAEAATAAAAAKAQADRSRSWGGESGRGGGLFSGLFSSFGRKLSHSKEQPRANLPQPEQQIGSEPSSPEDVATGMPEGEGAAADMVGDEIEVDEIEVDDGEADDGEAEMEALATPEKEKPTYLGGQYSKWVVLQRELLKAKHERLWEQRREKEEREQRQRSAAKMINDARRCYSESVRHSGTSFGRQQQRTGIAILRDILEIDPQHAMGKVLLGQIQASLENDTRRAQILAINRLMAKRETAKYEAFVEARCKALHGKRVTIPVEYDLERGEAGPTVSQEAPLGPIREGIIGQAAGGGRVWVHLPAESLEFRVWASDATKWVITGQDLGTADTTSDRERDHVRNESRGLGFFSRRSKATKAAAEEREEKTSLFSFLKTAIAMALPIVLPNAEAEKPEPEKNEPPLKSVEEVVRELADAGYKIHRDYKGYGMLPEAKGVSTMPTATPASPATPSKSSFFSRRSKPPLLNRGEWDSTHGGHVIPVC